jgi:hypothetical protein
VPITSDYRFGDSSVRAVRKMNLQGLELPEKPKYSMPKIPSDISSEASENLIDLMAEISSWIDYAEVQLASAQIDEEYEKQQLAEYAATVQLEHQEETKVTVMKAKMFEDAEYLAQRDKAHMAYAYRKMIETMYNRLERAKFIVSREITRRT